MSYLKNALFLKLSLVFILLCFTFTFAQVEDLKNEDIAVKKYSYEELRALEYDADVAESWDAETLSKYLTGNILMGIWAKSTTRQYFAPSGTTWYQEEENPQSHGTWRVRDDGKYCSVWPPSRVESCYTVSFMDDVLFWHSGRNRYPSVIQVIEKENDAEVFEDDVQNEDVSDKDESNQDETEDENN